MELSYYEATALALRSKRTKKQPQMTNTLKKQPKHYI